MVENNAKCLHCGHEWQKRTDKPIQCPKCGVRTWNRTERKRPYINRTKKSETKIMTKKIVRLE